MNMILIKHELAEFSYFSHTGSEYHPNMEYVGPCTDVQAKCKDNTLIN